MKSIFSQIFDIYRLILRGDLITQNIATEARGNLTQQSRDSYVVCIRHVFFINW